MGTGHIGRVRRLLAVAVVFVVAGLFAGQASAAYPGRNGQISFINDSSGSPQVGRVNPDGSDRVDLTHTSTKHESDWAAWSPNGNVIYFLSERDGFRCIWAQRLDGATKHPTGTPIPIQHFHTASRSMIPFTTNWLGLSATRAMLVFNVGDLAGNIWIARPAE